MLNVRLTPAEEAKVEADAAAFRLSVSGYARALLMGGVTPGTRQPPRQGPALEAAGKLLGQLNKIGSNLNQLARAANRGQITAPSDFVVCTAEVRTAVKQLMKAIHDY